MFDVLTNFLDTKIDYQTIFAFVGVYLLSLWIMFCLWVFIDAHKRYKRWLTAVFMSILVFIFNFPALIFYLIVRPEEDSWADAAHWADGAGHGGVQVPLVNFTGSNGEVQMTLNLSINPRVGTNPDMIIDVGWDSDRTDMAPAARERAGEKPGQASKPDRGEDFKHKLLSLRDKAKSSVKNIQSTVSSSATSSDSKKEDEVGIKLGAQPKKDADKGSEA